MKERPILFTGAMVRALLDGTKTQTRRVMKPQPEPIPVDAECGKPGFWIPFNAAQSMVRNEEMVWACPYGQTGDRLWVRETWGVVSNAWDDDGNLIDWTPDRAAMPVLEMPFGQGYYTGHVIYAADGSHEWAGDDDGGEPRSAWHPSIHMPRAASRILLEIVSVRVERLQGISEADARAEGVAIEDRHTVGYCAGEFLPPSIRAYRELWEAINGPQSWDVNSWVWVVAFRVIRGGSHGRA